jgi:hypothetical protein
MAVVMVVAVAAVLVVVEAEAKALAVAELVFHLLFVVISTAAAAGLSTT